MKKPPAKTLALAPSLFALRLLLYFSVLLLLYLHNGIVVHYDHRSLILFFFIIPLAALIAFLPPLGKRPLNKGITALALLCALAVWAGGWSTEALPYLLAGAVSFGLTLLLFHYPRWGGLSVLEPFCLAWICFRLLVYSRSGEDAAGETSGLTQIILVWTGVVFLLHSVVVHFCLHAGSSGGARREVLVFGLAMGAALAAVIFILPPDFIRHTVIANLLPDRIERMSKPSDNEWGIPDRGGGRRQGRRVVPGNENGQPGPGLRELSEHDWPGQGNQGRSGGRGDGDGESQQQYTVMIVASEEEPVYMGNAIRGRLDPVEGFLLSPEESLNRLPSQRFFVTWFDAEPVSDRGREVREVFALSTLPQNYLPYRPFSIEPTILTEESGPLKYVHRVKSNMHIDDPLSLLWTPVRNLNPRETAVLASYLELPLAEADREVFAAHLERVMKSWEKRREGVLGDIRNDYIEKIAAILLGFSDYQYNLNNDDNFSITALVEFLNHGNDGDCVEFSNTAALLGRLAGIPSRVVTGFLAAENLQTQAHLRGLAALRSRIPLLREFPFENLYLVTDAHAHSWTQFYVPDYGWLDFEATAFAIPPVGNGDANLRDVVIPLLDENRVFSQVRSFPWRAVLRALGFLAGIGLVGAYLLRYGREAALYLGVRRGGRQGARSLYLLLLARLAAEGKPIKPASKTAVEYARLFPGAGEEGPFAAFAALYTELRWRTFADTAGEAERFRLLSGEYRNILAANRRKGPAAFVIRIFSLRGLAYL